jgi:hypothetical protein
MSLDIYLTDSDGKEAYSASITHNLGRMAKEAGIYDCLWHPEDHGITTAAQIIEPLAAGVAMLATECGRFEAFNSPNGWGMWEHFLPFCARYLQACRDNPTANIRAST